MTTKTHPEIEMGDIEHLSGDHVLLIEEGHLGGGNHQGPDPALGAARVTDMINHTQGRIKGQGVHQEIGSRDA